MGIAGYSKLIACASMWLLCASAGASPLIVTNLNDSGAGSLRDQMNVANASAGEGIIEFQEGLTGTIPLESALPIIQEDLQILGPGPRAIAISGEQAYRVFEIDDGVEVTISGLALLEGRAMASGNGELGLGGCIWNKGSLILADAVIMGCSAEAAGGGIANDGDLVMRRSTVRGNTASPEEFAAGGGIDNFGTARIEESTISGNVAGDGGGIANGADAELILMNTTISGNSADFGGGLDNFGGALSVQFSTIVNNSADFGGGIINEGEAWIRNSLIADNPFGDDCDDQDGLSFEATGVNLDSDGSCPDFQQSTSAQIALGSLADNGGPTETHALGATSVALAAATDCTELDGTTLVETDQRGIPRPQGDACDVGAFEREPGDDEPDDVIFGDRFEVR